VWLKVVKRGTTIYWLCLLISHFIVVLSVDRIILSFRKPFLSFYIYLLLIWLCLFLILLSNDRTTSCSKSWDRYHFGSAAISVDFYVYVPINTYRHVITIKKIIIVDWILCPGEIKDYAIKTKFYNPLIGL
jgi:ABC-type microcin C transport system permease subunit YejE